MKALTLLVWLLWAAIVTRVLLSPVLGLTLSEALVLFLVCAPAVGLLTFLRWLLRPRDTVRSGLDRTNEDVNHETVTNHD